MSRDGYPDDLIKATLMDSIGQFRGIFFFNVWKMHVEDEKYIREHSASDCLSSLPTNSPSYQDIQEGRF
jgi:hypothetical protein